MPIEGSWELSETNHTIANVKNLIYLSIWKVKNESEKITRKPFWKDIARNLCPHILGVLSRALTVLILI